MSSPPSKPSPTTKPQCSHCASNNRFLLHHVQLRGIHRLLCTSCILRLHPSSFCPSCFQFFDHPLSATSSASAHRFLSCIKCSSLTHINCLPSPPPSFLCPPCSTPNFSFFDPTSASPVLDKNLALVLLCAAKIASASMNKAVSIARAKADRSVREAALARKRAKEALQHFSLLHKVRRTEGSLHVSGSRNLGTEGKDKLMKPPNPGPTFKEDFDGFTGFNKQPSLSPQNGSSVTSKDFDKKNESPGSFKGNETTSVEGKSKNDAKLGNNKHLQSSHGTVVDA